MFLTLPRTAARAPVLALLAVCAWLWAAMPAIADEGHDHGPSPMEAAPPLPRFVAATSRYDLVGVLQDRTLTVYLDHADTNVPVRQASLTLELAGATLQAEPHGDGEFVVKLPQTSAAADMEVIATVSADGQPERMTASLHVDDVRAEGHDDHASVMWRDFLAGATAAAVMIAIVAIIGKRVRRSNAAGARAPGDQS